MACASAVPPSRWWFSRARPAKTIASIEKHHSAEACPEPLEEARSAMMRVARQSERASSANGGNRQPTTDPGRCHEQRAARLRPGSGEDNRSGRAPHPFDRLTFQGHLNPGPQLQIRPVVLGKRGAQLRSASPHSGSRLLSNGRQLRHMPRRSGPRRWCSSSAAPHRQA